MEFGTKTIEDILDKCINDILIHGKHIDDCLEDYQKHRSILEPLLRTALKLRKGNETKISDETRLHSEIRLTNLISAKPRNENQKIQTNARGGQPASVHINRLRIAFLLILLALIFATFTMMGITRVSATAMPGDLLYPIKLRIEYIQMKLLNSDLERATYRLEIASRRIGEVNYLILQRKGDGLSRLIDEYNQNLTEVLTIVENSNNLKNEERSLLLSITNIWLTKKLGDLSVLLTQVPVINQAKIQNSLDISRISQERVIKLQKLYPQDIKQLPEIWKYATRFPELLETIVPLLTGTPTRINFGTPTTIWYYSETELFTPYLQGTPTLKQGNVKTKIATLLPSLTVTPKIPTPIPPSSRTPNPREGKPTRIPQTTWPTQWPSRP